MTVTAAVVTPEREKYSWLRTEGKQTSSPDLFYKALCMSCSLKVVVTLKEDLFPQVIHSRHALPTHAETCFVVNSRSTQIDNLD